MLVYLNELLNQTDPDKMSHTAMPATAMVNYIEKQMGDPNDPENEEWRNFPKILLRVITANTYLFTSLIEMGQKKQV